METLNISKLSKLLLILCLPIFFTACTEDEIPEPVDTSLQIPTTYNFDNVSYSGQTQRLDMLTELKAYLTTAHAGEQLDAAVLQAMYANTADAPWVKTYEASKQLRSKTLSVVQEDFDKLMLAMALASESTEPGTDGTPGVVTSLDGSKKYLLGANGLDYAQLIEKGIMGACLYYQATSVYMGAEKMEVDNETITPGEGTDMEHHWDEAFGYFGVPTDFPFSTDNLQFWGDYSNKRNAILGCNQKLMDALLKGRAAISANNLTARDEAISSARQEWELISVATALHYLNVSINNFDDMAINAHALSEAIGFIYALQFNTEQKITNSQSQDLIQLIAGSADFEEMNLYTTTLADVQAVKDQLADYYDLSDRKDEF